ncbi:MAG: hypothetical protein KME32_30080 [Mojavia pulchra JT2-VF2]|jgi:hypothetical protein|uniref:Uncharacterized protein n=1 Tax=Mojavia pulchra JT2-VF2 TaxID=287848 RepID=A0A951Q6T7_9NOST|nr:hypothetical protein [Mojavia pulchra JT2-VF2]
MADNSEITTIPEKSTGLEPSPAQSENISLLPRSAWNSQLTQLKVLLKAKQALDKSAQLNLEISRPDS